MKITHVKGKPHQFPYLMTNVCKALRASSIAALLVVCLSGCVTALIAGVAIFTVDIIHDRRTIGEYIDDGSIELTASNVASKPEYKRAAHIKTQSWNGVLLLTGEVEKPEVKQELLKKFQKIRGVRQVVDETIVTQKTGFGTRANDAWISSKVKSRLIVKTGLDANRVKVVTTRGNVYLMGIVTREEADKATGYASKMRGVKSVVRVFEYKDKP